MNFLAVTPKGAEFLNAIDCTGNRKTSAYIKGVLMHYTELLGADNVVQVRFGPSLHMLTNNNTYRCCRKANH